VHTGLPADKRDSKLLLLYITRRAVSNKYQNVRWIFTVYRNRVSKNKNDKERRTVARGTFFIKSSRSGDSQAKK
jgi:hypothetical protein